MYKNVSHGCCGGDSGYADSANFGSTAGYCDMSDGYKFGSHSTNMPATMPATMPGNMSANMLFHTAASSKQRYSFSDYRSRPSQYSASSPYSAVSNNAPMSDNYKKQEYDSHNSQRTAAPVLTLTKHADVESFFDAQFKELSFADEEYFLNSVRDCFEKTTGRRLPSNIKIHIFDSKNAGKFGIDSNVLGFAMNRIGKVSKQFVLPINTFDTFDTFYFDSTADSALESSSDKSSEIFVRLSSMAEMLVVAGHELGHVLTPQLWNMPTEEAKAYSFMLEWLSTIKLYNIAGLGAELRIPDPAKNNMHDTALGFVLEMEKQGWKPLNIFRGLCEGLMKLRA